MRILLLSAYDATSHQYWRQGLVENFGEYDWTVLSLPARNFSWRIRGNPLNWWQQNRAQLQQDYDLLIATSMVDLATLRGLATSLASVPAWLYCHENQFAFPQTERAHSSVEAQMVFLYASLTATHISFNSVYNRDTALQGIRDLFRQLPDKLDTALLDEIATRASVLPVPIHSSEVSPVKANTGTTLGAGTAPGQPLALLWNHRWEYDKGPARLLALVHQLLASGQRYRLFVAGQQFRQQPEEFAQIKTLLANNDTVELAHWGYVEDEQRYSQLMQQCDVVMSTAAHDFQGLSVIEAVQRGCVPLLPNRLAYPEWFAADYLYAGDEDIERESRQMFAQLQRWQQDGLPAVPDVSFLSWATLRSAYAATIKSCLPGAGKIYRY